MNVGEAECVAEQVEEIHSFRLARIRSSFFPPFETTHSFGKGVHICKSAYIKIWAICPY